MKRWSIVIVVWTIMLIPQAWAEEEDRIGQLEKRIAQLEARIEQLETLLEQQTVKPKPKPPAGIPEEVDQAIRARAAERYADDFRMQKTLIEMERKSYQAIQRMTIPDGVPEDIFQSILSKAKTRYANDFRMQKTLIEMELESYLAIQQ